MVNLYQYKGAIRIMKFIFHTVSLCIYKTSSRNDYVNQTKDSNAMGSYFIHAEQFVELGMPTDKRNDICTYICA